MKNHLLFAAISLTLLSSSLLSIGQIKTPPEKPRLIVQLVVSQMRHDYIQRFSAKFGDDGFMLLVNHGAVCKNAKYSHLITQPLPGLTTIATGAHPSTHGIISNGWYSMVTKEKVFALHDENAHTIGGGYNNGKFSPKNILTSSLGDELRITDARSKVIGVSLDPSSAIALSGRGANAAYWFDIGKGVWISNSYYLDSLPHWAEHLNAKQYASVYLDRPWNLLNDISSYFEADTAIGFSADAAKQIAAKVSRMSSGIVMPKPARGDFKSLLESPFGNTHTKDMAIEAIIGEKLGKDNHTDLLTIVFTPTRMVSEKFGSHSVELEDMYLRLDRDLAHLLSFLDQEIGSGNYLVVLTSDQGAVSSPIHLKNLKSQGGVFEWSHAEVLLSSYLNAVYGTERWVLGYQAKQFYLNRRLIEDSKLSLSDMQDEVVRFLLQFYAISDAITAHSLQTNSFAHGINRQFQNSYNQKRSGDVLINLLPGWVEQNSQFSSTGSPYNYDTHVPLVWYGWRIQQQQILSPACITDIAPTLSTLLNINWPSGAVGSPILEIIK